MKLSVIIKALNEETHIARAIESALGAVAEAGSGEVILADSLSTDRTVEIASRFPIRIVQLTHPEDRCCGVGAQLGYEIAQGDFIYILDGDMTFEPGFMTAAIQRMEQNPKLGGVGGMVKDMVIANEEFRRRLVKAKAHAHLQPGPVDRLHGGGLFRRSALVQVGYFTNRNLHSWEELELAVRLAANDWRMERLDMLAIRHYGHTESSYRLLLRRWRSKQVCGYGEILRQSWRHNHFKLVLQKLTDLRLFALVIVWWFALLGIWVLPLSMASLVFAFAFVLVLPLFFYVLRKRSIASAVFALASINLGTLGLVRGLLLRPMGPPTAKLRSKILQ